MHNKTKSKLISELEGARNRIRELESLLSEKKPMLLSQPACIGGRSADYLHSLVSAIPDLVWLKDPNGIYLACNSVFESFFGCIECYVYIIKS